MENNKQYNTSKKVRFSMLMAMLVLSSLLSTTFAASRAVLSYRHGDKLICHYFRKTPELKVFEDWSKKVVKIANRHGASGYLTDWLKDIKTIGEIIKSLNKKDKEHMDFEDLIAQYQAAQPSVWELLSCAPAPPAKKYVLVSIGRLSPAAFVSMDPGIAVVDELYRVSMRNWKLTDRAIAQKTYNLCIAVAKQELGEYHKIVERLTYSPLKDLASRLASMFGGNTAQVDKGNKSD